MTHGIRVSDLGALSASERAGVLKRLAEEANAVPNGQADAALARVRAFEAKYELSSTGLFERLKDGSVREAAEIAEWLFCLKLLAISGR